jgi:FAD/FMN-containing dehydrogenase
MRTRKQIAGWGGTAFVDARCLSPETEPEAYASLSQGPAIPRGLGRSYGDSSLASTVILSKRLDNFLHFEPETGILVCESGVDIGTLVDTMLPKGWFPAVVPGTRHVTIGGAIASDIHGKNHHCAGSFCDHVLFADVMLPDGRVVRCSLSEERELFAATCGGMGLTGFILRAAMRLQQVGSGWMEQLTFRSRDLGHTLELLEQHRQWPYSVAWVDCLKGGNQAGRSEVLLGRHAADGGFPSPAKAKLSVPFNLPSWFLNPPLMRAFNEIHYHQSKDNALRLVSPDNFFFPLDAIHDWNRLYGRRGFIQYQMVLPKESADESLRAVLEISRKMGGASLAVLKHFGKANGNLLSFPRPGVTLAMDFRNTNRVQRLIPKLDAIVLDYGGRLYLTKDSRMPRRVFDAGYSQADAFRELRARLNLSRTLQSSQSQRLEL